MVVVIVVVASRHGLVGRFVVAVVVVKCGFNVNAVRRTG